jgi:hypothetical protein
MVGSFPELEDQMVTWTPAQGGSPDRVDALVWAVTALAGTGAGVVFLSAWKAHAEKNEIDVPSVAREWRATVTDMKARR